VNVPHRFREPALLERALTHPSAGAGAGHNQRLEWLGDAVVQLVVTEWLIAAEPTWGEGEMTRARQRLVNTEALAILADRWALAEGVRVGRGEPRERIVALPKTRADAFEAVVAAIYLDGGIEPVRAAILPEFTSLLAGMGSLMDPRSRLMEWAQARGGGTPEYEVVATEGPPHAAVFHVAVRLDGATYGPAQASSKKAASAGAARLALVALGID